MPIAIEQTLQALQIIVQSVPVGTNLALLHLMWTILNGSFLGSRGAIFPALQESGFSVEEIRRSWQAMRYGAWCIDDLLQSWRDYVHQQKKWQVHNYEGYQPLAVDLTAFWRLRLKGWMGKYFNGKRQSDGQRDWFRLGRGSGTVGRSTPALTPKNPAS